MKFKPAHFSAFLAFALTASPARAMFGAVFECADFGSNCAAHQDDGGSTSSSIIVPAGSGIDCALTELAVHLELNLEERDDFQVRLQHVPSGILINLFNNVGGTGNEINVTLDDDATNPIDGPQCDAAADDCDGTLRPTDALSAFDGIDPSGEWKLFLLDSVSNGKGGDLVSWTVFLEYPDSDGDGLVDCYDPCPDDSNFHDADVDGIPDCLDGCPDDADKTAPGACGCGQEEEDDDGDGVPSCIDGCPDDPDKLDPGPCGCGNPDLDTDADGTFDCDDNCPSDPNPDQADANSDAIGDTCDAPAAGPAPCASGLYAPLAIAFGSLISSSRRRRRRSTHIPSAPSTRRTARILLIMFAIAAPGLRPERAVALGGVNFECADFGTKCEDPIPDDDSLISSIFVPEGAGINCAVTEVSVAVEIQHPDRLDLVLQLQHVPSGQFTQLGFGFGGHGADINIVFDDDDPDSIIGPECDDAGDPCTGTFHPLGMLSTFDGLDPAGEWRLFITDGDAANVGQLVSWRLIFSQTDGDGDGIADCYDPCPDDSNFLDSDLDGAPDCIDQCPDNPDKFSPGVCGCDRSDADDDSDGVANCLDNCPNDSDKLDPGICGCGTPDIDSDADGLLDCLDNCPADANPDQADSNADGIGDACEAPAAGPAPCAAGLLPSPLALMPLLLSGRRPRRAPDDRSPQD